MSELKASFSFPTRIEMGAGCVEQLGEIFSSLGLTRVLVVTDAGLAATETFQRVKAALDGAEAESVIFTEVDPNPIETNVQAATRCYQENQCDGVLGLGGGSPLDVAKAMRLLVKRPDLQLAQFDYQDDWFGLVPFVAIPTTAGTGSEVGRSSVITPSGTKRKAVLFHPALLAAVVLLDPELTVGLPAPLTAATGFDALTHCIESFTSPVFHPLCDGIALEGIRLIQDALPRVMRQPSDVDARGRLQVAASMGGIAFQKDLGAAHSMAHPLSTLYGLHHGLANALCLPAVMAFNAQRKPGVYRQVALALGQDVLRANDSDADQAALAGVRTLLELGNISLGLGQHGITADGIPALADEALADPCHQTNPVPVGREDFVELYQSAL